MFEDCIVGTIPLDERPLVLGCIIRNRGRKNERRKSHKGSSEVDGKKHLCSPVKEV